MTTFTITCPPTVGTFGSSRTGNTTISETATLDIELEASGFRTTNEKQSFQTLSNSDVFFTLQRTAEGGGAFSLNEQLEDLGTSSAVGTTQVTRSWNGAATTSQSNFSTTTFGSADIVVETTTFFTTSEPTASDTLTFTSIGPSYITSATGQNIFTTSASSFSTTAPQTTSSTRTTQQNSTFTTSTATTFQTGTLVSTTQRRAINTVTVSIPRTTVTPTSAVSTSASSFSTTRLTTTTQSHNITRWRINEGQSGTGAAFRVATVVLLDTSEAFYSLTKTVDGYEFVSDVASLDTGATEYTVFPTFETTEGGVFQSTSSSVQASTESYRASSFINTTVTVAGSAATAGFLPAQTITRGQINTLITTASTRTYASTVYTGDTSEITTRLTTLISAQIGSVSYDETAIYFGTQETSWPVAFTSSEEFSTIQNEGFVVDGSAVDTATVSIGRSEGQTAEWEREVSYYAQVFRPAADGTGVRAGGESYREARAALSSISQAALNVGAAGMTVSFPNLTFLTVLGARTAAAPASTTWAYVSNGSAVRVSADAVGLTATTRSGTGTDASQTTTSGSWTTQGDPVKLIPIFPTRRLNPAGVGATGGDLSVTRHAHIYLTSNNSTSGTTSFSEATTSIQPSSAQRTAFSVPVLALTGRHAGQPFASPTSAFLPYFTTQRNITSIASNPPGALL
jgi:hypothetical protein